MQIELVPVQLYKAFPQEMIILCKDTMCSIKEIWSTVHSHIDLLTQIKVFQFCS